MHDVLHFFCALAAIPVIFISTVPYIIILLSWIVISYFLPACWFHVVENGLWEWYQRMVVFFFEHMTGVEIYVEGAIPSIRENVIVISNHQTFSDWIVADFLAIRQNMVGNVRFVFKNALKYYPWYGFSFGTHGGVFVSRNGTYTDEKMKHTLEKLIKRETFLYLMLYPEGTRFCTTRADLLKKSCEFALKNNLEPLKQVLTPRVKAFNCALTTLRNYIDAVYDITIVYEKVDENCNDGLRYDAPNAFEFLCGKCKRIYINFERLSKDRVFAEIEQLSQNSHSSPPASTRWLHERFVKKDKILQRFFHEPSRAEHSRTRKGKRSVISMFSTLPAALTFAYTTFLLVYFETGQSILFYSTFILAPILSIISHFIY